MSVCLTKNVYEVSAEQFVIVTLPVVRVTFARIGFVSRAVAMIMLAKKHMHVSKDNAKVKCTEYIFI